MKENLKVNMEKNENKCSEHGPFLFVEDVSKHYANDCENKVFYTCICLECGKVADYPMSRADRNMTVYISSNMSAYDEFYNIRKRYLELKNINKEQIVEILNSEFKQLDRSFDECGDITIMEPCNKQKSLKR